jgi:hypothetical protein
MNIDTGIFQQHLEDVERKFDVYRQFTSGESKDAAWSAVVNAYRALQQSFTRLGRAVFAHVANALPEDLASVTARIQSRQVNE